MKNRSRPQYWNVPEPEKKHVVPNRQLGPTQEDILELLRGRGWVYTWEIDMVLHIGQGNHMLQMLQKLQKKGYLERKAGPGPDRAGRWHKKVYQWWAKEGGGE